MLIDSEKRMSTDMYAVQYENIPHFCPTPGTRDANGDLPFRKGLRAMDERRKAFSGESSAREQTASQNDKVHTRN